MVHEDLNLSPEFISSLKRCRKSWFYWLGDVESKLKAVADMIKNFGPKCENGEQMVLFRVGLNNETTTYETTLNFSVHIH